MILSATRFSTTSAGRRLVGSTEDRRMTREEFLARCGNAFDTGRARPEVFRVMERWLEIVMRLQGGQLALALSYLRDEAERTRGFQTRLANDQDGYAALEFAAILAHHCQRCATDRDAWWTRPGFCDHKSSAGTPAAASREDDGCLPSGSHEWITICRVCTETKSTEAR